MKTTIKAIAAIVALTTAAPSFAADAIRSNVNCNGVSVPGFITLSGTIDAYITSASINQCADLVASGSVTVIPDTVDMWDIASVEDYLRNDIGETRVTFRLDKGAPILDADGNRIGTEKVINGGW